MKVESLNLNPSSGATTAHVARPDSAPARRDLDSRMVRASMNTFATWPPVMPAPVICASRRIFIAARNEGSGRGCRFDAGAGDSKMA